MKDIHIQTYFKKFWLVIRIYTSQKISLKNILGLWSCGQISLVLCAGPYYHVTSDYTAC